MQTSYKILVASSICSIRLQAAMLKLLTTTTYIGLPKQTTSSRLEAKLLVNLKDTGQVTLLPVQRSSTWFVKEVTFSK